MRLIVRALLLLIASSCNKPQQIDQIYIRESGGIATDITVNGHGRGRFRVANYPKEKSGSFSWSPKHFSELQKRLEPFRTKAVPVTRESAEYFVMEPCHKGVPFMFDAGAVYIHWTGPRVDEHYLADLGCDYKRNAKRNDELLDIVKSFPIPSL